MQRIRSTMFHSLHIKSLVARLLLIATYVVGGIIIPANAHAQSSEANLNVMSFNVRYINTKDGENIWSNRKEKVAEVIVSNNIDLAGLQEPWLTQIKDLEQLLPGYAWFGWGRDKGNDEGEFCPIFFRKDKITVLEKGIFWLSDTPEKPGSKGWDVRYPRMVVWGRFRDLKSNKEFYFFNTHFGGQMARLESSKLLRRKIDEMTSGLPVIITGDLNSKPDSRAYEAMVSDRHKVQINDAFLTAHEKNDELYTDYWFDGENKDLKRIDYVFTSTQISVLYHEIINKRIVIYYPSDHLAIKANVQF